MNFIPTKLGFDSGENSLLPWEKHHFSPLFGRILCGIFVEPPAPNIAIEKIHHQLSWAECLFGDEQPGSVSKS